MSARCKFSTSYPLTGHLGHGIIQFHILLCNLPAILDRFRFLLESIGFNLTYTVSDV